jgi:hypothetical protein
LHDYYLRMGFEPCGFCVDPEYPSGKLFQKRTSRIEASDTPLLNQLLPVNQLLPARPSPDRSGEELVTA